MAHSHGTSALSGLDDFCHRDHHYHQGDRYGRMFPDLAPAFTDPRALERLGAPEGPMDELNDRQETTSVAVGHVFFGQFLDHDITLDLTSSLNGVNPAHETRNARTPTLDLDCVYGLGPEAQPYLFHQEGDYKGVKLITAADQGATGFQADDLARIGKRAVIGDFRNDENRIVSQIQLHMIRFHNRNCEDLYADGLRDKTLYEEARKRTMWHYQWCVVHDYLAHICGEGMVNRILGRGRQHYCPTVPYIPVEFSVAAYRFGHAMVPMKVQPGTGLPQFELFGDVFGRGFEPISDARAVCDMHELFDTYEGRIVQRTGRMDHKLSSELLRLPIPVDDQRRSLATRNLVRGQSFLLPSGEEVAAHLGRPEAEIDQISASALADEAELNGGTPLWYYILKEADIIGRERADGSHEPGEGLGPVGATIVAETIIGLIELDERSWLGSDRNWRPKADPDNAGVDLSTVGHMLTYV